MLDRSKDIATDDWCRACRGRGGHDEKVLIDGLYRNVTEPCFFCRGSGRQTIRVQE